MAWNWKVLIPGYGGIQQWKQIISNIKNDGYQPGDIFKGYFGFSNGEGSEESPMSTVNDQITDAFNNHNIAEQPDENGYQQVDVTPADPTSSAANVINYDPEKSANENLLAYAQANNSASAYDSFLQNKYQEELSNTAISRAIKDAEANGISKYQLFQSGNMAASSPSSAGASWRSYENAMDRRESWNEKELNAIVQIITSTLNAAAKMIG